MMHAVRGSTVVLSLTALAGLAPAQAPGKASTSITIYSSASPGAIDPNLYRPVAGQPAYGYAPPAIPGYALVREDREIALTGAVSEVRFTDVAALIDPTTVQFRCLTDPSAAVLEQSYQFDLVSGDKLLQKFIDRDVNVTVVRGDKPEVVSGRLLSSNFGQLVLSTAHGIDMLTGYQSVNFPKLPEGLITRPTLLWQVRTAQTGNHAARVSYQTEGVTWWADYNVAFTEGANANAGVLDVAAWVSIINQSGAAYQDATLKLIAGDVQRAPRSTYPAAAAAPQSELAAVRADAGFAEKSFFEYHLYTLGRPATLPNNSTKQIELFPAARGVACEKVLVYDGLGADTWWGDGLNTDQSFGAQSRKDVDVYLRFLNAKERGLGMPLPAGRVRVNKVDEADGSMEFIGEDVIRHTPRDEQVLVKMGRAFDVVGERVQTDFRLDSSRKQMDETYEITVRNHKEQAVEVVVQEHLFRWLQWEMVKASGKYEKKSSRLVQFPLTLKAGEEGVVRYTVRYTW